MNRYREALKEIAHYQRDQYESPYHAYDNCKRIARDALLSGRKMPLFDYLKYLPLALKTWIKG